MGWFRRELDSFDVDWERRGDKFVPVFPYVHPTPWRDHYLADSFLVVPKSLALQFADRSYMSRLWRQEPDRLAELAAQIAEDGLREPLTMYYDEAGKLRYHDGYHRLCVMENMDFIRVLPVLLKRSDRVKGYGRNVGPEIPLFLGTISDLIQSSSS